MMKEEREREREGIERREREIERVEKEERQRDRKKRDRREKREREKRGKTEVVEKWKENSCTTNKSSGSSSGPGTELPSW